MMEVIMLRWTCGVTRIDRVQNDWIQGTVKVVVLVKAQERRL